MIFMVFVVGEARDFLLQRKTRVNQRLQVKIPA